ncbi:transmembrane protein 263-like [Uloborus diversus]|uniref:transmembrane protein 263-like n=1 Tax=Uloborus diversus TaxID=327109 RepID=UPI002409C7AC|nr:transmembrane protein 263-like [Uloborus diversus]
MTTIANLVPRVIQPITACLKKPESSKTSEEEKSGTGEPTTEENNLKSMESEAPQSGLIWRVSSGLFSLGSGAVGLGVGSVKWAASTTYTVGTGVVSATQSVVGKVIPSTSPKPKKE